MLPVITVLLSLLPASPSAPQDRPNIVIIMADDLGFSDLGCYGSEIATPQLDALAERGLRFTQFYNTAKCHSSRISLLTGLYPFQAGNSSLSRGVTIAQVLRRAGYFTAMTGKWHLRGEPTEWGFEKYFGHLSGSTNCFVGDKSFRLNGEPFREFGEDFYTTDANTDYAIRFLEEAADAERPFFLYVAHNAPHYPLQAPREEVEKYRGKYLVGWDALRKARHERQLAMGLLPAKWKLSPRPDHVPAWDRLSEEQREWEDFRMAAFAGMVDRLDQSIGRLVSYLKKRGVLDNTVIFFCSDNGACPFERSRGRQFMPWDARSYWTYDTGWAHAGNTPFRWYKQNQHEGGISTPLVVHWPAGLKAAPGSISREPAHLIDLMATALDLAGAQYPTTFDGRDIEPLQGLSLLPVLRGAARAGHDWLYFQYSNNRAIRRDPWKLVSARGGPWELYNMDADRTELHDLAAEKPELVSELKALWHRVAREVEGAPERLRRPVGERIQPWPARKRLTLPKEPAPGETVELFNGKDLSGWQWRGKSPEARSPFSVKEGILCCTGRPAGYLRTEKKYTDFIFRVEWRWPEGSKPGNNGLLLRAQEGEHYFGNTWPKSIEAQLANGRAGDIFTIGEFPLTTGRNRGRYTPKRKDSSERPLGEWNRCEVMMEGGDLRIVVNGELQNVGEGAAVVPGYIGLQSEGAPIEFRNIRLIPSPGASSASGSAEAEPSDSGRKK